MRLLAEKTVWYQNRYRNGLTVVWVNAMVRGLVDHRSMAAAASSAAWVMGFIVFVMMSVVSGLVTVLYEEVGGED